MATFYLDLEGGNDAADGTSFANRWRSVTGGPTAARIAPGDVIRIMGSPAAESVGQNASFTNASPTVTLTSAETATVTNCETAWTASASVATTTSSTRREGSLSTSVAPAAGFTTGMMAYLDLGSTQDYSAYQQISFWFRSSISTLVASDISIRFCSDAAGVTTVNTFNLPQIPSSNRWAPIVIDNGAALSSTVRSIAIDMNVDRGAATFLLDNIIVCKAPGATGITHHSLLGKSTAGSGNEHWYPIRSIDGTTITIDTDADSAGTTTPPGYYGVTESAALYKKEPIIRGYNLTTNEVVQDSGTDTSPIVFSGGWNRTDMSTQTLDTVISDWNINRGCVLSTGNQNFVNFEKIVVVRSGLTSSENSAYTNCAYIAPTTSITPFNNSGYSWTDCQFSSYSGSMVAFSNGQCSANFEGCSFVNIGGAGISNDRGNSPNIFIRDTTIVSDGVPLSAPGRLQAYNSTFATHDGVGTALTPGCYTFLHNCTLTAATEVGAGATYVISRAHDATPGNDRIFAGGLGVITADTTVRQSASGASWKFTSVSPDICSYRPLNMVIARLVCAANKQVTVKAYLRRDNTALTGMLVCRGGQIAGVSSDVSDTMTASADTWDQRSISFTPTEAGQVEIEVWFYGGTTYNGWVHNVSVFQA